MVKCYEELPLIVRSKTRIALRVAQLDDPVGGCSDGSPLLRHLSAVEEKLFRTNTEAEASLESQSTRLQMILYVGRTGRVIQKGRTLSACY